MAPKDYTLTQDRLKELLHYCPDTGIFTWISDRGPVKKGCLADCVKLTKCNKKYILIGIDYKRYGAHCLAVLYMTGKLPNDEVDHEDGNGINNKWENLQPSTRIENQRNHRLHATNTSGINGVRWETDRKKWIAKISVQNRSINLGRFININDAIIARKMAETKYGFHKNHGTERPL